MMYEYKSKTGKLKKIITLFLITILASFVSILIYKMYINIDIYSTEDNDKTGTAVRLAQTTNKEDKEQDITEVLDKTIKCVVGISKIKNNGNSIFLNNSTQELGLGTGMVITENRIYTHKLARCRQ